jgi:hypothetical protein
MERWRRGYVFGASMENIGIGGGARSHVINRTLQGNWGRPQEKIAECHPPPSSPRHLARRNLARADVAHHLKAILRIAKLLLERISALEMTRTQGQKGVK